MPSRILYLDDEEDQIYTLKMLLSEFAEFELIGTTNANECFEILNNDPVPDIILLDIMMKEMSGWEVFDKIKSNPTWSKIPVIFLTARTDKLAYDAGSALGEGYIEKPFDNSIVARLHSILENKNTQNTISGTI